MNQNGQAIIEYILLLVVILTIFYGVGRAFFQPLAKFGSGVFTSTIACSLEYGQLPGAIVSEDGCSAAMDTSALASSKGGAQSGSSSNSSKNKSGDKNGANSNSSDSNKNKDSDKVGSTKDNKNSSKDKESGSGSNSNNSQARGGGSGASSARSMKIGGDAGAESSKGKTKEISLGNESGDGFSNEGSGGASGRRRRPKYKAITGSMAEEIEAKTKKSTGDRNLSRKTASSSGVEGGRPRRFDVTQKQKVLQRQDENSHWDLSKILRISLIVLMILAILIFVLFQLSSLRRSSNGG